MKNIIFKVFKDSRIKLAWTILMVFVAIYTLFSQKDYIVYLLKITEIKTILISLILIILGKLVIVLNQKMAQEGNWKTLNYSEHFYIYNFTQLSKYIPGFVWQFLGKAGAYSRTGLPYKDVRSSLATEVFYIIIGSGFAAIFYISLSESFNADNWPLLLFAPMLLVGFFSFKNYIHYNFFQKITYKFLLVHIFIWLLFGGSFYILLIADPTYWSFSGFLKVTGYNALSFLTGYLAFFAPGGIGVREGVLSFMLSGSLVNNIVTIVILHRLLIILVEVKLFFVSLLLKNYIRP